MSRDRLVREAVRALPLVTNVLAWLGVVIIAYGTISVLTGEAWRPVERHIVPIAATLTLLAVLLHAVLIYLPVRQLDSGPTGRYVIAPAVAVFCLIALFLIWYRGLPVSVVLGFAVLGLAWSLSRSVASDAAAERAPARLI